MNKEEYCLLRERGLSFFGAVTASLSHEINNAVAIVGELSGLLGDLLLGAEQGRPLDNKKLKKLSERISSQVKKGDSVIKCLNRFAHSVDESVKTFDLKELVEDIDIIAQRFAFLRKVCLEKKLDGETITITSNPFSLQQAIFTCIELALTASKTDDVVILKANEDGEGARITVESPSFGRRDKIETELSFLSVLMKDLGGTAKVIPVDDGRDLLILSVPQSMHPDNVEA